MGKKRTPLEVIHRAEDLVDELDGLVFTCSYFEERRAVNQGVPGPEGRPPTRSQVKKIQTKCNELWRTLQTYKDSI